MTGSGEGFVEHSAGAEERMITAEHEGRGLVVVREPEAGLGVGQKPLLADLRLPGPPLVLDRVLVHAALETLLQPASPALVPVGLVDRTLPLQVC